MMDSDNNPSGEPTGAQPWLQVQGSRHFLDWLAETRASLAFTSHQTRAILNSTPVGCGLVSQ